MKTGILTFHETTNFGSLLQTYALYKILHDEGVDCDIIDYQCEEIKKREFKYENINCWSVKNVLKYILFSKKSKKKHKDLLDFLRKNATISCRYNKENILDSNDAYDCFIVGSDIVWGLDVTGNDLTYFLDFVKDDKLRISYASSANQIVGNEYTDVIIQQLEKFSLIGVREEKTKLELAHYFPDKKVHLVCDPTMLVSPKDWINIALSSQYNDKLKNEQYILMYFPDGEGKMLDDAKYLKKELKLNVYCINDNIPLSGVKNIHISKLEDFLCYILHARIILSGSYHGSLFSMYFEKDFYYYIRAHGERMRTLSKILGVENRQAEYMDINCPVDYSVVSNRLNLYRKQSYEYINEMLIKIKGNESHGNDM